jgi:hypothetical protein
MEEGEFDWYRGTVQKVLSAEESLANASLERHRPVAQEWHERPRAAALHNKDKKLVYARPITPETRNVTWALRRSTALGKTSGRRARSSSQGARSHF